MSDKENKAFYRAIENEKDINPYGIQKSRAVEFLKSKILIEQEEVAAIDFLKSLGFEVRVSVRDGKELFSIADLKTNRINLTIDNGRVKSAAVY